MPACINGLIFSFRCCARAANINNNSVSSNQDTSDSNSDVDKLAIIQVNKNNSMCSIPSSPEEQYTQSIDGARIVRMLKNDLLEAVYSAKDDNLIIKRILFILDSLDKVDMNSSIFHTKMS